MSNTIFSPLLLLAVFCLLALLAAMAGGVLPALIRLTHTRLQIAVSFVAGLMLGLALLGLLPQRGMSGRAFTHHTDRARL